MLILTACLCPCLSQKAQQRLKLPVAPSLQRLQVYRWACQALATPPDHPILPLVWQKFLQLYLRQPGPEYGYDAHLYLNPPIKLWMHTIQIRALQERKRASSLPYGLATYVLPYKLNIHKHTHYYPQLEDLVEYIVHTQLGFYSHFE